MTNIFLTWDRRKNGGGVKLVLLDPNLLYVDLDIFKVFF